jgi:uncharacterized repeat protein (TIGR03803 family)
MNPSRLPFRLLPLIQLRTEKTRNRWLTRRKREPRSRWLFGALATVLAICILAPAGSAQTYQILFNFSGGMVGATPGGLTIDAAGRLYGTTFGGGGGGGTAFRLSRNGSGWVLTTLYSFNGTSHGSAPGILVFGPDGNLYGATSEGGGACNCGLVFRLRPPPHVCNRTLCPWEETVLYEFQGGSDGANPSGSPLVFDRAGNLYGTTVYGGEADSGTVYELSPSAGEWTETLVHIFGDGLDGSHPASSLTLDDAGDLYGTTENGGSFGIGTVYELSPTASGWTESILSSFQGVGIPVAGVVFDPAGNLYGGTLLSPGNAYELSPSSGGWSYTSLYQFNGGEDYGGVSGNLLRDASGNLYGPVMTGGTLGQGSIFELSPGSGGWTYENLHNFGQGRDGTGPQGSLVRDVNGNMYGSAAYGGQYGYGIIFEISSSGTQVK